MRARLAAWRDGLIADRDDLRPVAEGALHVTLVFLGYRPEKEAAAIAQAVSAATRGSEPPLLAAGEVVPVPPRRPRLFALDLVDEGQVAGALQDAVSSALHGGGFYTPEKRPYWPHVTLARVKRDRRADPLPAAPPALEPFRAEHVTLYRSSLRPQGAHYEPLAHAQL